MHGSLPSESGNASRPDSQPTENGDDTRSQKTEDKSDECGSLNTLRENSSSHPWLQLQTITPFSQLKTPSVASSPDQQTMLNEFTSQSSESSKSSSSCSDDSSDRDHIADMKRKKKSKQCNEPHSDPSHDRPRRSSQSLIFSHGPEGGNVMQKQNSQKYQISASNISHSKQHGTQRQYSASIDDRVSHVSSSHRYHIAVDNPKALRPIHKLSASLLIESLVDQLCKMMTTDSKQQRALYKIICNKLYDMHLINSTYAVDELQIVRNHYQKALYQLITMAKSTAQTPHKMEFLPPVPSVKMELPLGHNVMEVSRYKDEFEELEFLAKGGFGRVYRVRHRLDGAVYAVKKIYFKNNDHILQSFQEVKMLANLNHPNVVAYKAAWIEPVEYKDFDSNSSTSARSTGTATDTNESSNFKVELPPFNHGDCQDSLDIVFVDSTGEGDGVGIRDGKVVGGGDCSSGTGVKQPKRRITVDCGEERRCSRATKISVNAASPGSQLTELASSFQSKVSSSVSNAVLPYRSYVHSNEIRGKWVGFAILYVQMQLCELTLRHWLNKRNRSKTIDICSIIPLGLNLFRQIVQGIEYIHAQKIVHHDIKPSNIFLSHDLSLVQVGDFGLSCSLRQLRSQLKHGCNIGTPQYAAPEQLRGDCDPKSDIYSLGLILVEILVPFQTVMERAETLKNLRHGKVPVQLETASPAIAALVKRLVDPKSNLRPTATELLKELQDVQKLKCVVENKDDQDKIFNEIRAKYEAVIQSKDKEIESKDKEIYELRRRVFELERSASRESDEHTLETPP